MQLGELRPVVRLEQTAAWDPAGRLWLSGGDGSGRGRGPDGGSMRGQKMSESGETNAGAAKPTPGTPNGASVPPERGAATATPGTGERGPHRTGGRCGRVAGCSASRHSRGWSARDTLENLLTITTPRLWLALAACLVATSAAVIWAAHRVRSDDGERHRESSCPPPGVVNVTALAPGNGGERADRDGDPGRAQGQTPWLY